MWLEVLYWIDHVLSSKECVCCACGPSERLDAPSICFVCVFSMLDVISSFRSLRAGSQVFALLMLFLCVILHTISSCKSLQLLCTFPFGMLCLSAISIMFVKIMLAVCIILLLYALFNHPRLLIQVARVQKAQFSYRLDGLVP